MHDILDALRLSPSSVGIQPWKFIIVTNPSLRKKLREQAWDQAQITDASHLIVLCVNNHVDESYLEKLIHHMAKERAVPIASLQGLHEMMNNATRNRSEEERTAWFTRQVYIALGILRSPQFLEK